MNERCISCILLLFDAILIKQFDLPSGNQPDSIIQHLCQSVKSVAETLSSLVFEDIDFGRAEESHAADVADAARDEDLPVVAFAVEGV